MVDLFPVNSVEPAPFKISQKLIVHSIEAGWSVTGEVVAIIPANLKLSSPMIMHYFGKYIPGIEQVPVDRVVLQKEDGKYVTVPYRVDLYLFEEVE